MNLDFDTVLRVAGIAMPLLSAAISLWMYFRVADRKELQEVRIDQRNGAAELAGSLKLLAADVRMGATRDTDLDRRLVILETKMPHVPTHADLQGIRQEMRDLNEAVAAIGERSETTQEMVHSIQRYLLEGGRR